MDPTNETTKERHGCVTAWLVMMIILNSIMALIYLFAGDEVSKNFPGGIPDSMLLLLGICGMANIIFAVMLLQWKKWGFYGFIITCIAALIINLNIGLGIGQSLIGLIGIAILYGILRIPKNHVSTWDNLE